VKLDCCSRCKMAYYCSKACQTKQWRAGHKQACRKKGEIRPGDVMQHGMEEEHVIDTMLVTAIEAVPTDAKEEQWKVKPLRYQSKVEDAGIPPIPSSMLYHIRPAM